MANSTKGSAAAPKRAPIKSPIARRRYGDRTDPKRRIVVTIGKPEPHPEGDWACPFHIQGIPGKRPRYVFGIDALQALQMAIEAARFYLEGSGIELRWLDYETGETGISRLIPHAFGVSFERKVVRYIEHEVERQLRAREKRAKSA